MFGLKDIKPIPEVPEWKRDGKRCGRQTVQCVLELVAFAVISPVYLFLVLPTTIALQMVRFVFSRPTIRNRVPPEEDTIIVESLKPFEDRKYDIVLLGATGFTGRLGAEYLAKTYKDTKEIRWALAGRRPAALKALLEELGCAHIDVLEVDTTKDDTVAAMVNNTRAVASTAGPFVLHGTPVVRHCAHYGTHYVDITGEVQWVREMIDRFSVAARKSGAHIVHCCGHDSVPWDILSYALVAKRKERGNAELVSLEFANRIRSAPSGGTLDTIYNAVYPKEVYKASVSYDALLMTHENVASDKKSRNKPVFVTKKLGEWLSPSLMASVNSAIVKRSNALLQYGTQVTYHEGKVAGGMITAVCEIFEMLAFASIFACPPLLALARSYLFPKPGSGPSKKFMETGFLHVKGVAKFADGSKQSGTIYFNTDPGYRDTARMLVESGITLALTPKKDLPPGGEHTPASSMGFKLVERLSKGGTTLCLAKEE